MILPTVQAPVCIPTVWTTAVVTPHKCPVCDGTGLVSRPPGIAGDQATYTSTGTGPYPCRACGGRGVLWA